MIVVDTNILLYSSLQLNEAVFTQKAKALAKKESRWLIPALWRHEFLNVLCTAVRSNVLGLDQAWEAFALALAAHHGQESPFDMFRALALSQELGISGYDAQFLALAEASNTILVTEDKRLLKAAGERAMSIDQFLKPPGFSHGT